MGPVISASAERAILQYIETGKKEGRLLTGGDPPSATGYFVPPTVIADVDSKARMFQEEIFGPVLAVTKARDFDHAFDWRMTRNTASPARSLRQSGHRPPSASDSSSSAICTSTASALAPWWEPILSAVSICPEPIRRQAARTICCSLCRGNQSPKK